MKTIHIEIPGYLGMVVQYQELKHLYLLSYGLSPFKYFSVNQQHHQLQQEEQDKNDKFSN